MTRSPTNAPSRTHAPPPIRHGRLRRRGSAAGIVQLLAVGVAVVLVSALTVTTVAVARTAAEVRGGIRLTQLAGQPHAPSPQIGSVPGAANILLAGTDTRTGQAGFQNRADLASSSGVGNNDVTMVLHISADHQRAVVVSIPRDLLVSIPACPRPGGGTAPPASLAMFNTTLSRGGLGCTVLAAEQLTGLDIQYAAQISFSGVIGMSDAVGGVSVCLATPLKDPYVGLDLSAGQQTLVGSSALAFVRSRYGVGDGSDLGRISNQQLFLSALMRKITGAGVLSNPITLYSLANVALKNMRFSDTLSSPLTMVSLALALKNISLANMVFVQYPSTSNPAYPGRVVPAVASAAALRSALVADLPIVLAGKLGRAAVAAPGAPAAAPSASASPAPGASSPAASTTAPAPGPSAVVLPPDVTGQTAQQQTCSKSNSG